jgi:hypothetical protein
MLLKNLVLVNLQLDLNEILIKKELLDERLYEADDELKLDEVVENHEQQNELKKKHEI